MTMDRSALTTLLVLLAAAGSTDCRDTPLAENVRANNLTPTARAGLMQMLDYNGSPVSVTLDGSASSDPDGTIATYRWLSGNDAPDGGIGRGGVDPADETSPTVMLGAGTWEFTLFVIDNEGGVSKPATVAIQVGNDLPAEVVACIGAADPVIADDCKQCVCSIDDACRDLFVACDEPCWTFYTCVENNCRSLTTSPDDADALADCARANCMAFFGGVGPWIPLETCVRREPCGAICSDSVQGM